MLFDIWPKRDALRYNPLDTYNCLDLEDMFFFMILQDKRVCTCDLHFSVLGSLGSKPPLVEWFRHPNRCQLSRPAGALSWPILCRCVGHRPDADPTRDDVTMVENCIERWGPDNIYNEFQWIVAETNISKEKDCFKGNLEPETSSNIFKPRFFPSKSSNYYGIFLQTFPSRTSTTLVISWQKIDHPPQRNHRPMAGTWKNRALHFDLKMLILILIAWFSIKINHKKKHTRSMGIKKDPIHGGT